jgi:hypothetical protein
MKNINPNPFRNFDINPVNDDGDVVNGLRASIRKSDFWPNLEARPVDPDITLEDLEKMEAKANGKPVNLAIQLCYGHNRSRSAELEGIKFINLHIQPHSVFTDDMMLTKMAYENKNDAKNNMMVIVETVKQAKEYLEDQIKPFEDYKSYKEAGLTFFDKKASFVNAKNQGIGFKTVLKFLDGWSHGDVQYAHRVIDDLARGYYGNEQIHNMPNVAVMGQFSNMVGKIRQMDWPEYFKDKTITEVADIIQDPSVSTTTKIMKNAISALSDGKDPVKYIKSTQRVDFNLVKATKDLVFDNMESELKLEDLPTLDGFKDYPELEDLMKKVETSIKRTEAARDAGEEEVDEAEEVAADTEEAAEAATPSDPGLPPVDEEEDTGEMPIGALVANYIQGTAYLANNVDALVERSSEVDDDADDFLDALEVNFVNAAKMVIEYFDPEDAQKMLDQVLEG